MLVPHVDKPTTPVTKTAANLTPFETPYRT